MNYFVTAIDTDSGKTLVSAILCEALNADYWKPVQAGQPRDSNTIRSLVSNTSSVVHPEKYVLSKPASPHAAALADSVEIRLSDFMVPHTTRDLVIEGAGGCLVPLNDREFVVDLITHLKCSAILVADLYLGSINHTLLTLEALKKRSINIKGIIFNGDRNPESENIILLHAGVPKLLHVQKEKTVDRNIVKKYADAIKPVLQ